MSFVKNYVNADGRSSRRRIFILSISLILLTALIAGLSIAGILVHRSNSKSPPPPDSTQDAIRSICSVTLYPKSCFSALISADSSDPEKLFRFLLSAAIGAIESISHIPAAYAMKAGDDHRAKLALGVCGDMLSDAADSLNDTLSAAAAGDGASVPGENYFDDLTTWLSSAVTCLSTCLDALEESGASFAGEVAVLMRNSTELASNGLAIVAKLLSALAGDPLHRRRRLLAADDEFPTWLGEEERRMMLAEEEPAMPTPNITVAKDGTGNYKTLAEAVEKIPKKSNVRFVIYVKGGVYKESVELKKELWNVMMYGDRYPKNATVISAQKNNRDNITTTSTATFSVKGRGFFSRDITFENTAGAENHQAVAMQSQSDLSVFYRCTFNGYQDTLYSHTNRQLYRECNVTGTVDFIFGNAAVVLQKCFIMPRKPLVNQMNTITAQGRTDPNQNTGISIMWCVIKPDLGKNFTEDTYLGRPWKLYSRTVFMMTEMGELVNPKGWMSWDQVDTHLPNTTFYGEYMNIGPGANTSGRFKWNGYHPNLSLENASRFTVEKLINGDKWLNAKEVPFDLSLNITRPQG